MKPVTRYTLLALGHACVALGAVGIFLPLLPTTPFLLLAAACYVRSSERHYRWITENRVFGPPIRDYQQKRAIRFKTKILALSVLWASLLFSSTRTEKPFVEGILLTTGILCTAMILRIRTLRE